MPARRAQGAVVIPPPGSWEQWWEQPCLPSPTHLTPSTYRTTRSRFTASDHRPRATGDSPKLNCHLCCQRQKSQPQSGWVPTMALLPKGREKHHFGFSSVCRMLYAQHTFAQVHREGLWISGVAEAF